MTQNNIQLPFNHSRAKKIYWISLLLIGFAILLCTMEYTWAKQAGTYVNHLNNAYLYADGPNLYIEKLNTLLGNESRFRMFSASIRQQCIA